MGKEERFLIELNRRAKLWERMKATAEKCVELDNIHKPLAKIDIEVAERALARIAKKKEELLGVASMTEAEYPAPAEVAGKDEEPIVEEPKKRILKKPEALFTYVPGRDDSETTVKDEEGEHIHSHPKGTLGKAKESIGGESA